MKKNFFFITFILMLIFTTQTTSAKDADEMTFFGCSTTNHVKTCSYGYPQTDVGKVITYYYTNNMVIKKKEITHHAPFIFSRTIYNYNSKGQLKTNKYGNASRYVYSYETDNNTYKSYIVYREIKKYDSNQNASYREFRYTDAAGKVKTRDKRYYKNNKITQKKFYKYNSNGQLKTNKYGKAYRKITKYKLNKKKKPYIYSKQIRYYKSNGKLA